MKQKLILLGLLLGASFGLNSCSTRDASVASGTSSGGAIVSSPLNGVGTATNTCTPSASLVLGSVTQPVALNAQVPFTLSVSGCSASSYTVSIPANSNFGTQPFTGNSYSFNLSFSTAASNYVVTVLVQALDANQSVLGSAMASSSAFNIGSTGTVLTGGTIPTSWSCTATLMSPTQVATENAAGQIQSPAIFQITISSGSVNTTLVSVTGANVTASNLDTVQGVSHSATLSINQIGFVPLTATVAAVGASMNTQSCQATALVNATVIQPPAAPTCSLVPTPAVVNPGSPVSVQLLGNGSITSATLNGQAVSADGNPQSTDSGRGQLHGQWHRDGRRRNGKLLDHLYRAESLPRFLQRAGFHERHRLPPSGLGRRHEASGC